MIVDTFDKSICSMNKERKKINTRLRGINLFCAFFLTIHVICVHTNQDLQIPQVNYCIYSFIMQQIFIDVGLYAKHCARYSITKVRKTGNNDLNTH